MNKTFNILWDTAYDQDDEGRLVEKVPQGLPTSVQADSFMFSSTSDYNMILMFFGSDNRPIHAFTKVPISITLAEEPLVQDNT